jgi:hypothetical protein
MMRPELQDGEFVFCTVSPERYEELDVRPVGWFREEEGVTLILERDIAEGAGLAYVYESRMITLSVHSSLEAVGFLAVITKALAVADISVNAVSAYYHDHLFVQLEKVELALGVLNRLILEADLES